MKPSVEECVERVRAVIEGSPVSENCRLGTAVHEAAEKALREGVSPEEAVRAGVLAAAPDKVTRQILKAFTFTMKGAGPEGLDP